MHSWTKVKKKTADQRRQWRKRKKDEHEIFDCVNWYVDLRLSLIGSIKSGFTYEKDILIESPQSWQSWWQTWKNDGHRRVRISSYVTVWFDWIWQLFKHSPVLDIQVHQLDEDRSKMCTESDIICSFNSWENNTIYHLSMQQRRKRKTIFSVI